MPKIVNSEEISLRRRPVDDKAYRWIANQGWARENFRPSPDGPTQSCDSYWRILGLVATEKGRQLTVEEVQYDWNAHQLIVVYLHVKYWAGRAKMYATDPRTVAATMWQIQRLFPQAIPLLERVEPAVEKAMRRDRVRNKR